MKTVKKIFMVIAAAMVLICLWCVICAHISKTNVYAETKAINSSADLGEDFEDNDVVQLHATINLASNLQVAKNITLDLNGQNIFNVNDSVIVVRSGACLTIEDTSVNQDGAISNGKGLNIDGETYGGGVFIESGGSVIFKSGVISGNCATYGAGIFVDNGASFEMQGGIITGNNPDNAEAGKFGGGVYVIEGGTFIMSGGDITDNKATENGAGVYMAGDMTITGKQYIGDNKLTSGVLNNLFLTDDNKINVSGALISSHEDEPNIGVTLDSYDSAREVTSGYGVNNMESEDEDIDPATFFCFDDDDYSVAEFNLEFAVPAGAMTLPSFASDLIVTIIAGGGTYGAVVPAVATEINGAPIAFVYTYSGTSNDGTTYGPSERVPKKAGNYTVVVTTQDPNYNLQETSAEFIIAKAQITKPTEATTELDYSLLPVDFIVDKGGNQNTVTVCLTDKYNYEWSDGTTDDVVISLTSADAADPDTQSDDTAKINSDGTATNKDVWLWVVVALAAVLVIVTISIVAYWINRAKKAERLNEELMKKNNKTFVAVPGILAVDYVLYGIVGVAVLVVIAIAVVLALHLKGVSGKKKSDTTVTDNEPEQLKIDGEENLKDEDDPAQVVYDSVAEEPSLKDYYSYFNYEEDDGAYEAVAEEDLPQGATKVEEQLSIYDANGEVEEILKSVDKATNTAYVVRYKKSFMARLIQSWDESKEYYSELKNEIMSYDTAKSRISWNYDCIKAGDNTVIKIDVRGKTLCLYFALVPEDYENTKYKVERSQIKKCEDAPCLYRMSNPTRVSNAKELIAAVFAKYGVAKTKHRHDKYDFPYENTPALVERGLAKEYYAKEKYDEFIENSKKSKEKAEEREKQTKRRDTMAKVVKLRREKIEKEEVNDIIPDDVAAELVSDERNGKTYSGKKDIVNIDTLSANYTRGEIVNLENLKEKGLIPKNATAVKVLARGSLTKPLTVQAQDFSLEAVKMIALTGGSAVKV